MSTKKALETTPKLLQAEVKPPKFYFPENFQPVYTNHSNMVLSESDLKIDFGIKSIKQVGKDFETSIYMSSCIIMSPQHMKIFVSKLKDLLDSYEKDFGKINIKPKNE